MRRAGGHRWGRGDGCACLRWWIPRLVRGSTVVCALLALVGAAGTCTWGWLMPFSKIPASVGCPDLVRVVFQLAGCCVYSSYYYYYSFYPPHLRVTPSSGAGRAPYA